MAKLLTIEEVAARSRYTVNYLRNLASAGQLPPHVAKRGRFFLYAASDITRWLRERAPIRRRTLIEGRGRRIRP